MILCGMWPLKLKSPFLQHAYKTYRLFMRLELIGALLLCGPITVPYAFFIDKTLFSETLSYEIQYITLLLKVWVFESEAARNLLKESLEIEERMADSGIQENLRILRRNKRINVKLSIIYTLMITSAFVMFCNALLIQTETNWKEIERNLNGTLSSKSVKRQPIVFTLPYMSGGWFYIGMFAQTLGVIFVILYSIATQSIFFTYVTFTVAQIQALRHSLKNFEENVDYSICQSKESCIEQSLKRNILTHQKLIRYVKSLDGFLKYATLFDFAFYSLQIGATVSKILSEIKHSEYSAVLFHVNYLCFNYLGLHFNYTSAYEIIFESSGLSMSIYESRWYEQKVNIRRSYIMMMRQMKHPLCLHIGPLYAMSNEMLILIIKAAYSYVTLLSKSSE
ncbi:uncharacterized protein LOC123307818 [Coccinella septempunctata]|uniref:uncharacterized protein LOC123307818 n=1 Tax=Coccinella septempunctata TaxID=41139 RepID=UPI001D09266B|nr:uncharacterized protein LOC123307818 [Coccinella septempunctata]